MRSRPDVDPGGLEVSLAATDLRLALIESDRRQPHRGPCDDPRSTVQCPRHGCASCFIGAGFECRTCWDLICPPVLDGCENWRYGCLSCECGRCLCQVPVCRNCFRCAEHVSFRTLRYWNVGTRAWDTVLADCMVHEWRDPQTGRWE